MTREIFSTPPMNLAELERAEVEAAVGELGVPGYHGRQVFRWLYRRGMTRFDEMTDLHAR